MNILLRLADLSIGRCLLGSAIIGALYYSVGYDSGTKFKTEMAASRVQMAKVEEELAKLERQIKEILVLKAAQDRDAERLNALMAFIPEKLTKTDMMRTLSNEAKAVGVNINQIRDSGMVRSRGQKVGADPTEFYEEIGVDIDLVGGFPQLVLFLANLTRLNQILSVASLELSGGGGVGKDDLAMTAKILGYRYLGAEAIAKIEAAKKSPKGKKGAPAAAGAKKK